MTSPRTVLRDVITGERNRLIRASTLLSLHQAGEALVPVLIGVIIDQSVSAPGRTATADLSRLLGWIAVLGLVFLTLSLSYRVGARQAEAAAEWTTQRLRLRLTQRVLHPRGGAEAGRLPGALTSIAASDAERAGAVHVALPNGIAAVVAMLVGGIALLRVSWILGLVVLLGGPFLLALVGLMGRPLESRIEAEQEQAARASGVAADLVAGLRALAGIGAQDNAAARYRVTSRDSLAATLRAARAQAGYEGSMLLVSGVFLAGVALAGGALAARGTITVGQLVAAVGLAQFLLGPLQVFAWVNGELASGRASAGRIAAVLATGPAVGGTRSDPGHQLVIRELSAGPLQRLSLTVPPGQLLGVVAAESGPVAALLHVLARDGDPDSGSVELGAVPLTDVDPGHARSVLLVAAHDADLFSGTLAENVAPNDRPGPGTEAAMAASRADEVRSILAGGWDGVLAERGGNLSGGQRQRVALARALATDAPVLVLHDPTTAVDSVTQAQIAGALAGHRQGRTTILVTTSPALLAVTDRVVVLADGRLDADSTHAELIRSDPRYRELVLS